MKYITTLEQLTAHCAYLEGFNPYEGETDAADLNFARFKKELERSENFVKQYIIGATIYAADDADVDALCEGLVAQMAAKKFIPKLDLAFTDGGFVVTSNSNQAPASRERIERLLKSTDESIIENLEILQDYLEGRDDLYDDWKTVDACSRYDNFPLPTLSTFKRYAIGFDGRKADYIKLVPKMNDVVSRYMVKYFGTAFYLWYLSNADSFSETETLKMAFAALTLGKEHEGLDLLSSLETFLIDNREDYPTFDAFYVAPESWENTEENTITALL